MKSIKILKDTSCGGRYVKKGQVIDASPADAHYLVATLKAIAADPVEAQKVKTRKPANKMIAAEDMETRDAGE